MDFSQDDFETIATLDLEPIKVKLMHKESGEGWSLDRANAAEFEYRRFLYLMKKFPHEQAAPSMEVDTFWHYHILDTLKYAEDCEAVFGYFLHHFPYMGLRGEDDLIAHQRVGERMRFLYEDTFGDRYPYGADSGHEESSEAMSKADAATAFSLTPGSAAAFSLTPSRATLARNTSAATVSPRRSPPAFSLNPSATAFSLTPSAPAFSLTPSATAFSLTPSATALSLTRPRLTVQ